MPVQIRADLAAYVERCSALAPEHRWVRPASLHLTLQFLGSVSPEQVAAVSAQLRTIAISPFNLALGGLGTFGGTRARVTWLGLSEGHGAIRALADTVGSCCAAAGVASAEGTRGRSSNPHVTLGRSRARHGAPLPQLPATPVLPGWIVEGFSLYRSRLGPGGAEYTVMESFRR